MSLFAGRSFMLTLMLLGLALTMQSTAPLVHATHECVYNEFNENGPWVCPEHDDENNQTSDSGGGASSSGSSADDDPVGSDEGKAPPPETDDTSSQGEDLEFLSTTDIAYLEGELLIQFNPQATTAQIDAVLQTLDAQILRVFGQVGVTHIRTNLPDTLDALQRCRDLPAVSICDLNGLWSLFAAPNDPAFLLQWPLLPDSIGPQAAIGIQPAWDADLIDSSTVWVAVIDSGVDLSHADLGQNLLNAGYDLVHGDPLPEDNIGHGTFVAGIIGALGNNDLDVTGVSWRAALIPLKAADHLSALERAAINLGALIRTGSFSAMAWSAFIDAMDRVIQLVKAGKNLKIVNLSAGGVHADVVQHVIGKVVEHDLLLVTAAGNGEVGQDVDGAMFPCSYPHERIVCVTSVGRTGRLSSFSNFGPRSVDLAAPGERIVGLLAHDVSGEGTLLDGVTGQPAGEGLVVAGGTSFAAAYVSGVLALLAAACEGVSALDLKVVLLENTRVSTDLEGKVASSGYLHWPEILPPACG